MKIRELEEEVRDLQCKLDDYEILKQKLENKTVELQNKRKEINIDDKIDIIEYKRNQKLETVVNGLVSKYDGGDVDEFINKLTVKNIIPHACVMHNLKISTVVEQIKKKIIGD